MGTTTKTQRLPKVGSGVRIPLSAHQGHGGGRFQGRVNGWLAVRCHGCGDTIFVTDEQFEQARRG